MEGHGLRIMAEVFGGMKNIGDLVIPLGKESDVVLLNSIMMGDVFPKLMIKNGIYGMAIIGMMLETKSKSNVAINQKV